MSLLIALFLIFPVSVGAEQSEALTPADGADFEQAVAALNQNVSDLSKQPGAANSNRTVVFSERSLNGYLRFQGKSLLPTGLSNVSIEIQEGGRLIGTGMLNLDEIGDFPGGSTGALKFLSGSLPVSITVGVEETDRRLHFTLEVVQIGPVTLPSTLAGLLVRRYSVSGRYPDGFDVSAPALLPSAVQDIHIQQGRISIVTQ
ncbi:uncharacterized protein METZ01_LOCUS336879 [marine metagenome]|uniref:Uncharacterized protein n=1 Tax=marine metagenome TaxID=408172 RepID=A0A382QGL0_9ZZZZ